MQDMYFFIRHRQDIVEIRYPSVRRITKRVSAKQNVGGTGFENRKKAEKVALAVEFSARCRNNEKHTLGRYFVRFGKLMQDGPLVRLVRGGSLALFGALVQDGTLARYCTCGKLPLCDTLHLYGTYAFMVQPNL